jgi:lysyl-tRNA synthetase class 2
LTALSIMPPAAGNALGIDRLVMWLLGAKQIAEVIPFSAARLFPRT